MVLSPKAGDYVRVYRSTGADQNYADEVMQEVNLSASKWGSASRYTIYRITADAKRIMNDTALPSFGKLIHGAAGGYGLTVSDLLENDDLLLPNDAIAIDALDVSEVWYGAGYIVVSPALNSDDVVYCHTGKYLATTDILGCSTKQFETKTKMVEITSMGDGAVKRFPTIDDWAGKIEVFSDSGIPVNYATLRFSRVAFRFYGDYTAGLMHVGFGYISDVEYIGGPSDVLKAGIVIQGAKYKLRYVAE